MNTAPKTETQPADGNNLVAVLNNCRKGQPMFELGEALRDVTAAVLATGKKGSIKLTITIRKDSKSDSEMLRIRAKVVPDIPKADEGESVFFGDSAGNISRDPIEQPELPGLGVVQQPAPPLASIPAAPAVSAAR